MAFGVVGILALGACDQVSPSEPVRDDAVLQFGFESGDGGWVGSATRSGIQYGTTTRSAHRGDRSYQMGPSNCPANCGNQTSNPANVDVTYALNGRFVERITLWVMEDSDRSDNFGQSFGLWADGELLAGSDPHSHQGKGTWVRIDVEVGRPVGTLQFGGHDMTSSGALFVDDIVIE